MGKMFDNLVKFMESDEGKVAMLEFNEKLDRKRLRRDSNISKVKSLFNNQSEFDNLVEKLINHNDDDWRTSCYKKGCEPYPTNLLNSLFDLVWKEGKEGDVDDPIVDDFPTEIFEYMGWQFAITHGQGSIITIYKNNIIKFRM